MVQKGDEQEFRHLVTAKPFIWNIRSELINLVSILFTMPRYKQFKKETVLEAASEIFHRKGYNGTSIDDILKATGLSRSSLYDSFRDKHTLYLEALEFYKTRERNGYETMNSTAMNGMEKIQTLFREVVNHLITHPDDNGCLMVNAAAEMSKRCEKTSQVICNNKEDIAHLFTIWLTDAQDRGVISLSKEPASYSAFLFNSLCGLKVLSQSGAVKSELENVAKVTLDAIV
jgi:TetR/AcrR family transcriptional regulator, transcriptional repressor for nem operon